MKIGGGWASRRRARRWAIFLGLLVVGWLLASVAVTFRLTSRRRPPFAEPAPAVSWAKFEDRRLTAGDGLEFGVWYAKGPGDGPSVIVLHGNKGSRANSRTRAEVHASAGAGALLLPSLRAHGDSEGRLNDFGHGARKDVVAAVEFLHRERPGKPIIVHGVSMGAAAAILSAGEVAGRVDGYVLESPYADLETAVWNRTHVYLPPVLDVVAYAGLRLTAPLLLPDFKAIAPIRAIGQIPEDVPVLIISGGGDELASPVEAEALADRKRGLVEVQMFPAGHNGVFESDAPRFRRLVLDFDRRVEEVRGGR